MNNGQPQPVSETPPAADGALVRRFANCRDEAAFAELVARYQGLVYGVCGRVLQHRQDVEDAFQAAFLVLARDAAEIRSRESIAAWLYGVAHRIALHARAKKSRRRETTWNEIEVMGPPNPFAELAQRSELQALDEELNLLPEKYREPLVLHYLLNRTAPQIAEELDLTQTAVEGRLKRGRDRLRKQLARRGIGLTAILPVLALCQSSAEASLNAALVNQTIQAGLSFTSAGHPPPLYSHEAANLAAKEIGTMTTTSAGTFTAMALSATAIIGLAVGIAGSAPAPGRDGATDGGEIVLGDDSAQLETSKIIPAIHVGAVQAKRPAGAIAGDAGLGGVAGQPPAKPAGVDDLLRRRLQILEQIAKLSRSALKKGTGNVSQVLKSEVDVLNAKLELARTPTERVAIRKDILQRFRELQGPLNRSFAAGAISPGETYRATAARLQAEADLLRELAASNRKRAGGGIVGTARSDSLSAENPNRHPTTFDLKPRSVTEQKILAELDSVTKVDFDIGVSIKDALADIAESHQIKIIPDKHALDQAQITLHELQTRVALSGIKLHSLLRIILQEHRLDYVLKNEVLQITTIQAAREFHTTRVYDVSHLSKIDSTALSTLITGTFGDWKSEGEPNGGAISSLPGILVVKQNQGTHRKIIDLLQQLDRVPAAKEAGRFFGGTPSKRAKPKRPQKSRGSRGEGGRGSGGFGGAGGGFGGGSPTKPKSRR